MSQLLEAPATLQVVDQSLLEALGTEAAVRPSPARISEKGHGRPYDIEGFIKRHELDVSGPDEWNGSQGPGRRWEFNQSRMCIHDDRRAFILQHNSGAISAGCLHDSCAWDWKDLRETYEPEADVGPPDDAGDTKRRSQATLLVTLCDAVELWTCQESEIAFASWEIGGHREHWPVRSRAFKEWLLHKYYQKFEGVASSQAIGDATALLAGRARYDGVVHQSSIRVATQGGKLFLDLCDREWRAVEIDDKGWRFAAPCPVRFRRVKAMGQLQPPETGGDIAELRRFVNVADDEWPLLLGWLVAAFFPKGPYPILMLHGEQGSAKSTTARVLRRLIDPNLADLRCEPKDPRDLMIAANNGWIIALDNLSNIKIWMSDALCRLATGGGFSTRKLYENDEESIFNAMRPCLINGIEELAARSDLLDRGLVLNLPTIDEGHRRTEEQFWSEFASARGRILGAVLDGVVSAIRNLPTTEIPTLPRLADFAKIATAAESEFGLHRGEFMESYSRNRNTANDVALGNSPIVQAILRIGDSWQGSARELLLKLKECSSLPDSTSDTWPKNPRSLSGTLRRLAPNLRAIGIEITFGKTTDRSRTRIIKITRLEADSCVRTVQCVQSLEKAAVFADDADGNPLPSDASPDGSGFDASPFSENGCGSSDDADASSMGLSGTSSWLTTRGLDQFLEQENRSAVG